MIKIFSGIRDWNFAGQVKEWLYELGSDYEVYDCKLTSAYDSDANEIYVTAIFFYKQVQVTIKPEFCSNEKEFINYAQSDEVNQLANFYIEKLKKPEINVNKIDEPKKMTKTEEVDWVDLLNRLSGVIRDSSVDLSEPYASGRRKR